MQKTILKAVALLILFFTPPLWPTDQKQPKIVGLVPVHNEEIMIADCLRALALITDAIVVLDDVSQDNSVAIVKSLQSACNIERIHEKKVWFRDEPGDRNLMLTLGREIGGTHFIVLDADEMFTADCLKNNFLRSTILAMHPGDRLELHWIRLWKSINEFRQDGELKDFIFCDDGQCSYQSGFIHTPRVPDNLYHGIRTSIRPYIDYGVLHFQAVNWRNMEIRQAWYRCLTRIRNPHLPTHKVNISGDCTNVTPDLMQSPKKWFDYTFFNPALYELADTWRENQILGWFDEYGRGYFADLDVWHIDWPEKK